MIRTLLTLMLCASPLQAQAEERAIESSLLAIGSPDSVVRQAAERWLAAHLQAEHFEILAAALRSGDMELRRRLARAIGKSDRDLRLSNALLASAEPALSDVGRRALEFSITDWSDSAWRRGIYGPSLGLHLRLLSGDSWPQIIRLPILPSLGETCGLLARMRGLPLGLTLEPSVADRRPAEGIDEAQGTWDELLVRLGEIYRVSLDGHGFDPDPKRVKGPRFLRYCPAMLLSQPTSGVLIAWCQTVAGGGPIALRVSAARALAHSGWDAGLEWLSARVVDERDAAALEGLLAAAAEGRTGTALRDAALQRSMIDTAQADLERGDPDGRAARILGAFQHRRAMGPGGVSRAEEILSGWEQASLAGRWLRLAILARLRSTEARGLAAGLLVDGDQKPVLYRQALETWVAASAGLEGVNRPILANPGLLFGAFDDLEAALSLSRRLALSGFVPPDAWGWPEGLPSSFGFLDRAALLSWFVLLQDAPSSAALWKELLSRDRWLWRQDSLRFSNVLSALGPAHRDTLHAAWMLARQEPASGWIQLSVDRSAFLAGLLDQGESVRVWNAMVTTFEKEGPDLMGLAVLSASGWNAVTGRKVRAQLLELLSLALRKEHTVEQSGDLIAALERSVGEMEKSGWELSYLGVEQGRRSMAEQWSEQIRRLAGRSRRSPLGGYFAQHWPPALESGWRDLEREARLPLSELKSP